MNKIIFVDWLILIHYCVLYNIRKILLNIKFKIAFIGKTTFPWQGHFRVNGMKLYFLRVISCIYQNLQVYSKINK